MIEEIPPMTEAEKLHILIEHSKALIHLMERIADIETGMEIDSKLEDFMVNQCKTDLAKHHELLQWLFKLIVHLAKNGEIRTLLEAHFNKQQKKPLTIVVAFDGDEGGRKAMNRFVIEQLCGDPEKFKIGANLDKRMNALEENLEGLTIHYSSTLKEINELSKKRKDTY